MKFCHNLYIYDILQTYTGRIIGFLVIQTVY